MSAAGYDLTQDSMAALEAMVSRATIPGVWLAFFRECVSNGRAGRQQLRSAWSPQDREAFTPFIVGTTPRVRSMFGW